MLKRLNNILNVVMGSSVGVIVGHTIYVCWEHRKYPDLYAMQSAPWYTSIVVYGVVTAIVLLITIVLKCIVRKKLKNH